MYKVISENKQWIDATWEKIEAKLSRTAVKSRNKLPYTTVNGVHSDRNAEGVPQAWTNGFWGGLMWLMYQATGKEDYRITAECSEKMLDAALEKYEYLSHDVGFMWHLTSGANYRLTGNEKSKERNLYAASTLAARYHVDGDFILAWNAVSRAGCSIIDCLMNLAQLYWASEELQEDRFKRIAMRHMDMTVRDHIRPDGSVNHVVQHDMDKVGVVRIQDGQGYSPESCWSRGLSWAVYGSMISYIHAGKPEYLEAAKKTADYFIAHCKETNWLPLVDFCAPAEPVYYDSTAGVCAACGMLEIAKHTEGAESKKYAEAAVNILKAIDANWCNYEEDQDALVLMGSERYPFTEEEVKTRMHKPIIYGDFFFVEAILKLKGSDFLIW